MDFVSEWWKAAKIFRALYLNDVIWVLLGSAVTASDSASRSSRGDLASDIGMLVFFAAQGLILRALAVSAERNGVAARAPSSEA